MTGSSVEFTENVDLLKMFFQSEFEVTDNISIHTPTVRDVVNFKGGEVAFFFMLHIFVGNTTFFKVLLWDNGIDWNKISDYAMFCKMVRGLSVDQTKIFFGDLDFQNFKLIKRFHTNKSHEIETEKVLYDPINDVELTEVTYFRIRHYLRTMFDIFPEVEVGIKGKRMKREIIAYDRRKAEKNSGKSGSYFLSLISTLLMSPGFKYNSKEVLDISVFELLDSAKRMSVYEQCNATLHGMMSGFVDGSKIKPESYDFFADIYSDRRSETKKEQVERVNKESMKSNDK